MQGAVELQHDDATFKASYRSVFGPEDGQERVFQSVAQVVDDALLGFNSSVIAYGQTGTGKTHTMMGPAHLKTEAGVFAPRPRPSLLSEMNNIAVHRILSMIVSGTRRCKSQIR